MKEVQKVGGGETEAGLKTAGGKREPDLFSEGRWGPPNLATKNIQVKGEPLQK